MKIIRFASLSVVLFFCCSFASAQQSVSPREKNASDLLKFKIIEAEMAAKLYALDPEGQKDKIRAHDRLAALYREAATDPANTEELVARIYGEYQTNQNLVKSAAQGSQVASEASVRFQLLLAAQNEVLIQQNKRVIELLERIANKK